MYRLNTFLLDNLHSMLGVTQTEVSQKVFGNVYMYARRLKNKENITLQELVRICNVFRISITRFITSKNDDFYPANRNGYVIDKEIFRPIVFHPERIRWMYGKNSLVFGLTRDEFARDMKVSTTTVLQWINAEMSRVSVYQMIDLCNMYKIDMKKFIDDENLDIDGIQEEQTICRENISSRLWRDLETMKRSLSEANRKICILTKENEQLRDNARVDYLLSENDTVGYKDVNMVRKWEVNSKLMANLHTVLGISQTELIKVGGRVNTTASLSGGDLLIRSLVAICNRFHISTRHFFVRQGQCSDELMEYNAYRETDWEPVKFHPEYINDLFGKDSLTGMTRTMLIQTDSVSEWKIRAWRRENSTMRMSDLIELCNEFDLTPACFITDNNRSELGYAVTYTEAILEENRLLRHRLIKLERKLKERKRSSGSTDERVEGTSSK